MFTLILLGKEIVVQTIWEAVWYIGIEVAVEVEGPGHQLLFSSKLLFVQGIGSRPSYQSLNLPSEIHTPPLAFFAVAIGIDEYKYARTSELPNLTGCVADADAIVEYLTTKLHVPEDHIKNLRNSEATRANIIQSIRALARDERIRRNDPILIFYAGHGGEVASPPGWSTTGHIQMLLPHDFLPDTTNDAESQGLPDITFGYLLEELARAKGNNISVIFDSCHSGSGTRTSGNAVKHGDVGRVTARSAVLKKDYQALPSLDSELHHSLGLGGSRKASFSEPGTTGLDSHVLLAATSSKGVAREQNGRGAFTSALLELLEHVSPETLSYVDAIDRLPDLPEQFPQCEGANKSRALFNGRAPKGTRLLYRVVKNDGILVLEAGEAQGIAEGAEFHLFKGKDANASHYGTTSIKESPRACTSILRYPTLSDGLVPKLDEIPSILWALQVHVGHNVSKICVALPADGAFVPLIRRVVRSMEECRPTKRNISLVDTSKPHELSLRIVNGAVVFDIKDQQVNSFGVTRIAHTVPVGNEENMFLVLSRAADFYHHFRRSNKCRSIAQQVTLKAYTLSQQSIDNQNLWMPINAHDNLNIKGTMTVNVDELHTYGFSLSNDSADPLYVWAFLFEMCDLSITTAYGSNSAKRRHDELPLDPDIPPHGKLTIGYGDGGAQRVHFVIDNDSDVEITYLKIFITTMPRDLSFIAQDSPFSDVRKGIVMRDSPPKDAWDTLTMAIVASHG